MDNQISVQTQTTDSTAEPTAKTDLAKSGSRRPPRPWSFPLTLVQTPEGPQVMNPTRLAEYEASLAAKKAAQDEARARARATRREALAAGRPDGSPGATQSLAPSALSAPLAASVPPDFERHSRCCSICSHPDRDAIEADFVRWRSPIQIAEDYEIPDRRNIYRHAHATGLFALRSRQVARVMEQYLELVDHDSSESASLVDFDTVTRAIRVYSHLDENGRWFEPVRTLHVIAESLATGEAPEFARRGRPPGARTRIKFTKRASSRKIRRRAR